MITHLRGTLVECTPTHAVVECGGVGYFVTITLSTFEAIQNLKEVLLYTEHLLSDKGEGLYGFHTREEREMFRRLISVSGIGPSTARVILSALSVSELVQAISTGDVRRLKAIKGVGEKSAQRLIVDLKDVVSQWDSAIVVPGTHHAAVEEALAALAALGFSRSVAEKALSKVKNPQELALETLIKETLKNI
jgi:Holliday junction DNA helicase RuvA